MDYVPDTSVIIDGRFTLFISERQGSRVILPEAMISEVEHQANEGRSTGFAALQELKSLRNMAREEKISLDTSGRRPSEWQIKRAKSGEIDEIIRNTAAELGAVLVTGDQIQRDIALIKGIDVQYLEPLVKEPRNIEEFFDDMTSSVHIKAEMEPVAKKGIPGNVTLEKYDYKVSRSELEDIANHIVKRGRNEEGSFIEIDAHGATVIQLKNIRIVITRPPFSDDLEITAVRPVKKLDIEYYQLTPELLARLSDKANGILVAGGPGQGKSTFVQAFADYLSSQRKIVKTMERPRDLQVRPEITQYTGLEGSMEKTGDILLLVREDYTVFDEMRVTSDFKVYSDLRLAGVGMIGVVHATRAIDAIQRFIGRIELGMIPQVIDTIIFIDKGQVAQVYYTSYSVKVPSGMNEEDLSRPVIEVKDFYTNEPVFEIYTFGEEIVVVPISSREKKNPVSRIAEDSILKDVRNMLGTSQVEVKVGEGNKLSIFTDETHIPRLIGRKGETVNSLEKKYGMKIDVEPLEKKDKGRRFEANVTVKNKIIYLEVGKPNTMVKFYVDNILILQAKSSNKGLVKIKMISDNGAAIYNYIKAGKKIEYGYVNE
ncbi:MAG: PINc/VapC family ATPase [Thermoplasmatales archaeon]|nr:PINc/VapC family ATPase [Thermoplasmatales archaeon]